MRTFWPELAILCLLVSVLVPGIGSASTAAGAETRVWAFDLPEQGGAGIERSLTLELHRGCAPTYDRVASGSLLAARGVSRFGDDVANAVRRGGRAPEFPGGQITESGLLRQADDYLGAGYREASPGRYVSADGMRQVRYGPHEVGGGRHHAHFEAYDAPGGHVIENTVVDLVPDVP